jgi:hypothetical protein
MMSGHEGASMPRFTFLAAAVLLATACRSPEERLVDRRNDLRRDLDALYAEYQEATRADDRAQPPPDDAERAAPRDVRAAATGLLGRVVAELDRTHFEETCLAIGRGERPFVLSDRLATFVADSGHADRCRRAARISADVSALEREVGERRSRPAP